MVVDRKSVIVTGQRRRCIQMIEVDLNKDQRDFTIVNSIQGLMGRRGNVYSYAMWLNTDLNRELSLRCKAGILNDLGMPR